jgi:putative sigma-54 modulation protein
MIRRIDINGVHLEVGDELKKYVYKKLGRVDRFVPRHNRQSMHLEVKLKEGHAKDKNERTCEVILHLPGDNITVKESTINMYAAIDIVETKLRNQLKKYKDLHTSPRLRQRLLAKLKHRPVPSEQ